MTGEDRPSQDAPEAPASLMRTGDGRAVLAEQAGAPPPQKPPARPPTRAAASGWPVWLAGGVLLLFLGFHLFAGTAHFLGDPATVLNRFLSPLPFGQTLSTAAAGWTWLPGWAVIGATALRLRALGQLLRNPPNAMAMALLASLFEGGFWLVAGRGWSHAPGQVSDMMWVLALEVAVLLSLTVLLLGTTRGRGPDPGGSEAA